MKRVLVVHPFLRPHGGGQSVGAWTLEALKTSSELSLLTWTPVDCQAINSFFGTFLSAHDLRTYRSVQGRLLASDLWSACERLWSHLELPQSECTRSVASIE